MFPCLYFCRYGYVSFASKAAADLAIGTFDDQLQLPGAMHKLSVYYAKKQHDQLQDRESCPARNAKLYFCGTPSGFKRDSVLALFSAFGRVRHLQVYTDSFGVLSSGTVTMYTTEEATAAMTNLDGKVLQAGTAPLKVNCRLQIRFVCPQPIVSKLSMCKCHPHSHTVYTLCVRTMRSIHPLR